MHASTIELLSLRDGEPVAAEVAQHVEQCMQCSGERARLAALRDQLRRLDAQTVPQAAGDDDDLMWSRITAALHSPERPVRSPNRVLALAAVAVWAVVGLIWFGLADPDGASPQLVREDPPPAVVVPDDPPAMAALVGRSRQLERVLSGLPQRPRVEQAATAATLDALEERIQWLDYALSRTEVADVAAGEAEVLWAERVELLDSLVTLRYAQAERTYF